ncbi:hypothetical protein Tco_0707650 [Tanacetum coccineum]|uniref:Gag-Pol polyprotein n=1 Tax=Tanacetum coccineum TaxID=301880 RepID=A0ABQ4YAS4_9ASTR
MSTENIAHYQVEKEAIHLLLSGIGVEIYSTVDACKIGHKIWIAIDRLQQGESLNIQDVKTNLFWEFGIFTSHDGESMESYYSRFYKMMNEMIRNNLEVATMQVNVQFLQQLQPEWSKFVIIVKQIHDLDTVSYHNLFDILKQYQKELNKICVERIAKNANPLALVAATQQYPDPYYQAPKPQRSYAPAPKQHSSTRSNVSTRHKGKEIAKPITPPSKSASKEDNKQIGQFGNQRTVTIVGDRETVGSQKTKKEQADWLEDTDEEIDEQELEVHYCYMGKIQEVPTTDSRTDIEPLEKVQYDAEYNVFANERQHSEQPESINNTCVVEKVYSNFISDSPDMCDNDIQTDQNAKECDDERVVLANLINKEIELEKYKTYLTRTTEYDTLERKLKETQTQKENDIKEDAYNELQCLYLHKVKECECLAEKLSNQTENLKKLNEKYKEKSVGNKFGKPLIVRQRNALKIPKPSVLGVIYKTSDSRPKLKSTQRKDKVVQNNSQLKSKKTEVEDHLRISSISYKTKSVTACNDCLKSRTLNVNAVCATCGKCVYNSSHGAYVSKFLNDVTARSKKV